MTAATLQFQAARPVGASDRLRQVALVRIAAGEGRASRAVLAQDLAPIVPHRLPLGQWRALIDREIEGLLADGFAIEAGAHLAVSDAGSASVRRFLGVKGTLPRGWQELRDVRLIAKALGLERLAAKDLKLLARPDGLRAAVVQTAYKLKIKGIASPSRLRSALAALALQRAFGNQIKAGLAGKGGLSAKAGRLLAGQLCACPTRLWHRHPSDRRTCRRADRRQASRCRSAAARRPLSLSRWRRCQRQGCPYARRRAPPTCSRSRL